MSLINAISIAHYTTLANNASYSMMKLNNNRMNMISNMSAGFGLYSPETLSAMDTEFEINSLTYSLQYKFAKAMLEQLKKQQKEDAEKFSTFA